MEHVFGCPGTFGGRVNGLLNGFSIGCFTRLIPAFLSVSFHGIHSFTGLDRATGFFDGLSCLKSFGSGLVCPLASAVLVYPMMKEPVSLLLGSFRYSLNSPASLVHDLVLCIFVW